MIGYVNLPDTVVRHVSGAPDSWGIPTSGESITYKARVSNKNQKVTNANGDEVVSRGSILLHGMVPVTMEDRYTIRYDGVDVETVRPVDYRYMKDLSGKVLYTKVVY